MSLARCSGFLIAGVVFGGSLAGAQTQAGGVPTFKVNSSLVLVDVVATDHSGAGVTDLKQEELRVTEDGKERPIKSLKLETATNSEARRRVAESVKATLAKLPAGVSTNLREIGAVPTEVASTVLLLDGLNTPLDSRLNVRREMVKALQQLDVNQPIAIYALGNSLTVLQEFTTDAGVLRAAAQKASTKGALQGMDSELGDHGSSGIMEALAPGIVSARMSEFESATGTMEQDVRVQRTLDAFDSIARRLASVPGRKNLIWLSSTFPLDLYPGGDFSGPWVRHYADTLQATLVNLENARIAVYPVNANGLEVGFNVRSNRPMGRVGAGVFVSQVQESQDTMNLVAEETGGRAYYNRNDLNRAIASAIADGSSYYALAFTPAKAEVDGRVHRVKVTSSRKGVVLHYREAYLSFDQNVPSKQRIQYMKQEMSNALTDKGHLATGVIVYAKLNRDGKSVDVVVDSNFLTIASAENKMRVQLQVATAVFDGKDKALNSGADVVGTEFEAGKLNAFLQAGVHFKAPIERPAEAKRVRVAVRDLASDRIGTVDVGLN
ncbi:MAG: VWA domain-containing protein [Acidobacteriales bacterium]|nr:VWA domain-containing protein [Terriglobales bacterium]